MFSWNLTTLSNSLSSAAYAEKANPVSLVRGQRLKRHHLGTNPQRTADKVGLIGIVPLMLRLTILDEALQAAVCARG